MMLKATFQIEQIHGEFLNAYKAYGFKDKSSMVRAALDRFKTELERQQSLQAVQGIVIKPERADKSREQAKCESPQREWIDPITGMEFVRVPEGRFLMGQTEAENAYLIGEFEAEEYLEYYLDELPQHEVILSGFWMGKYPVTQEQWVAVMGTNPSYFQQDRVGEKWRTHPVEQVSWDDGQEFLKQLNEQVRSNRFSGQEGLLKQSLQTEFRLPSEAEWEYACRAGTATIFFFGDDVRQLPNYAWYLENSGVRTQPVGQLKPNAWGLYDMHGNVWEWCQDWYQSDYYGQSPIKNPWGPLSGLGHVKRGGSWTHPVGSCRAANRLYEAHDFRYANLGFRLVWK
jgi:formylglycine-generating enzyme required for sulfatase activity